MNDLVSQFGGGGGSSGGGGGQASAASASSTSGQSFGGYHAGEGQGLSSVAIIGIAATVIFGIIGLLIAIKKH